MAKYIDLPNLKENLTNFLNKKINPIYAKKTEIPSNVSELNNDKSYQTAEEVGQAVTDGVARIVAGAPEDFDTLKEMSDWISSHETSAAAMNSAISDNSVAIANHTSNSDIHVTKEEKTKWNKLDSDLKDGTIIVAEATKATQDAQGNVIDSTYAKKTEMPQGTVVDDALSSTSTNPVQNKVVKAEFDQVNSNLDGLGYGENGAKNIFKDYDEMGFYSRSSENYNGYPIIYSNKAWDGAYQSDLVIKNGVTYTISAYVKGSGNVFCFGSKSISIGASKALTDNFKRVSFTYKPTEDISKIRLENSTTGGLYIACFQIEEGDTATPYKPYIPSVKMLADEVSAQNESLDDYGLNNLYDGLTRNGYYSGAGAFTSNNGAIANVNPYKCNAGDIITIKTDITRTDSRIVFLNSSGGAVSYVDNDFDKVSVPANATSFVFNFSPTNFNHIGIYINNAIDELKNDLSDLKISDVPCGKNLYAGTDLTGTRYVDIPVKDLGIDKNKKYTFSFVITSSDTDVNTSGVFINSTYEGDSTKQLERNKRVYATFLGSKIEYCSVYAGRDWATSTNDTITVSNIQIEEGTQATDYEPYIPSVKMLAEENKKQSTEMLDIKMLGWSVPKECLIQNSVSGNVFTQKVGRVDLGSLNWTYDSSNGQFYSDIYSTLPSANEWNKNVYSLKYTISSLTIGLSDKSVGIYGGRIYIKDSSYTDASAFKQAMQGQYLYYELATPTTKTIDDNEIITKLNSDLSNLKYGTTPVAKAVADEDGNNIKSTYATKAKAFIDYSHKSVDLDTLTTAPSLISIGYDVTNKPSKFYGGYMFVVNAGYSASIALYQILFDVLYNKTYQRKYYHGSWTAWSYVTTPQDIETITLTTTSGTATLYKLGKMRHLVLNNATFSSTNVIASTDASVGTLYIRAEILISGSGGDELEGAAASFEDICISGSSMWNATRTATGTSPIAVQGATGSATWIVQ